MRTVLTAEGVGSTNLHPRTKKEIEKHGAQKVFNNRSNAANLAKANGTLTFAKGLEQEANLIAKIYCVGPPT